MTTDTKLLPLPEYAEIVGGMVVAMPIGGFNKHIRASVEANTAAQAAEIDALRTRLEDTVRDSTNKIEALRAELREAWSAVDSKAGWEWKKRAEQAEARAERLAEALRVLADAFESRMADEENPDWNECWNNAHALLRELEQGK